MPPQKLKDLFGCDNLPNFPARYNAAPLQDMPVIIRHRMGMARWGLLPPWLGADDKGVCAKMINARSETVFEKPAFRDSWKKGRRCLIPANGFYEWKKDEENGINQPYYIHRRDNAVFAFAGLWAKLDGLVTFTVLTKDADGDIAGLHHRSPVMIDPGQARGWFDASHNEALAIMRQSCARHMVYHAVSTDVGKVANDSEALIEAITLPRQQALAI